MFYYLILSFCSPMPNSLMMFELAIERYAHQCGLVTEAEEKIGEQNAAIIFLDKGSYSLLLSQSDRNAVVVRWKGARAYARGHSRAVDRNVGAPARSVSCIDCASHLR